MRSVCGCTPASSAATEMTYTARIWAARGSFGSIGIGYTPRCSREAAGRVSASASTACRCSLVRWVGTVTCTVGLLGLDTPALHPEDLARRRARGDLQGDRGALEGGHGELGAEGGLGEGDRHDEREVLAVAAEHGVVLDVDDDEQVARRPAVAAGAAPALEPDALAVGDARGDADLDLSRPSLDAGATTGGAGVGDDRVGPAARRARRGEREHALVVVEHAAAVAVLAGRRAAARTGARAVAGAARHVAGEVEGRGDAGDGLAERQVKLGLEVAAPLGSTAPRGAAAAPTATATAAEQTAEQVAEVGTLEAEASGCAAGTGGEPARALAAAEAHAPHGAERADLVVLLALGLVTHDVVGGRDRLEALLGGGVVGVGVGMELPRQLAVGARDLLRRRLLRDAEDLVVVLLEPLALCRH